jgi:hypothetical protein
MNHERFVRQESLSQPIRLPTVNLLMILFRSFVYAFKRHAEFEQPCARRSRTVLYFHGAVLYVFQSRKAATAASATVRRKIKQPYPRRTAPVFDVTLSMIA